MLQTSGVATKAAQEMPRILQVNIVYVTSHQVTQVTGLLPRLPPKAVSSRWHVDKAVIDINVIDISEHKKNIQVVHFVVLGVRNASFSRCPVH